MLPLAHNMNNCYLLGNNICDKHSEIRDDDQFYYVNRSELALQLANADIII